MSNAASGYAPANKCLQRDRSTNKLAGRAFISPASHEISCPSIQQLFLRSLRLLGLNADLRFPGIAVDTFRDRPDARTSQKERVQKAEWVLYWLFQRWDAAETKAKLDPFFPAYEPLQSVKLRAVFFQWLNSLKHQGVLERSCVLRKSMLDECKSSRFEELLFHFSSAVLRKVAFKRPRSKTVTECERLTRKNAPTEAEIEQMNVLLYVYEERLQSAICEKRLQRDYLGELHSGILNKQREIEDLRAHAKESTNAHQAVMLEVGIQSEVMKRQVRHNAPGERTWIDLILSGDINEDRDEFIEEEFSDIWTRALGGDQHPVQPVNNGSVVNLEQRAKEQQSRVQKWRQFQNQVSKRNERFIAITPSPRKQAVKSLTKSSRKVLEGTPSVRRTTSLKTTRDGQNRSTSPTKKAHQFLVNALDDTVPAEATPSSTLHQPGPSLPSLTERTRRTLNPNERTDSSILPVKSPPEPPPHLPTSNPQVLNLAERTRQSMALMSTALMSTQKPSNDTLKRRESKKASDSPLLRRQQSTKKKKQFPVNPFDYEDRSTVQSPPIDEGIAANVHEDIESDALNPQPEHEDTKNPKPMEGEFDDAFTSRNRLRRSPPL